VLQVSQFRSEKGVQTDPPPPLIPCPIGQAGEHVIQSWPVSNDLNETLAGQGPQTLSAFTVQAEPPFPLVPSPWSQAAAEHVLQLRNVPLFQVEVATQLVHVRSADAVHATSTPCPVGHVAVQAWQLRPVPSLNDVRHAPQTRSAVAVQAEPPFPLMPSPAEQVEEQLVQERPTALS
jgi:hypothetical protein